MRLTVICVGKAQGAPAELSGEYQKRIRRYASIDVVEIAEEKFRGTPTSGDKQRIMAKEAGRIQSALREQRYIVLDPVGQAMTSEELAMMLEQDAVTARGDLAFVIGGPLGLDSSLKQSAQGAISLSKMTLPHQIARVVLMEQLYRAFTIIRGEPYHK